jgi:ferredoxin
METDSVPVSLHVWLKNDSTAPVGEPTAVTELNYEALIKFGACCLANQVLKDASLAPGLQLWSLIGWNVSLLELECRSKDRALGVSRTQKALLQRLVHTARMLADVDPQTRSQSKANSRTLLATEHSDPRQALLTLDPFTALVRVLAAWPTEVANQFIFALVEKLAAVCLLQALLARAKAAPNVEAVYSVGTMLTEEDAEALLLFRLQAAIVHACSAGAAELRSAAPNFSQALLEQQPEAKVVPADLKMYTITSMLVFLRRAALLLSVLELQPSKVQLDGLYCVPTLLAPETGLAQDSDEFDTLRELLRLPDVTAIGRRCLDEDRQLTWDWLRDLSLAAHALDSSKHGLGSLSHIPSVSAPVELHLIVLPELYHDLFKMYRESRCPQCEQIPDQPTLCLICGALVCSTNSPCPENCIQVHSLRVSRRALFLTLARAFSACASACPTDFNTLHAFVPDFICSWRGCHAARQALRGRYWDFSRA